MRKAVSLLPLFFLATVSLADVRAASLFTDHMVLQRGVGAPVWGWASPGEHVHVTGSWHAQADTTAGQDGKWMVRLDTKAAAGGPYTLTIQGQNSLTFNDVMLGEVWLLSGQSNMEWNFGQVVEKAPADARDANQPMIRFFNVPNIRSRTALENVEAKWTICTPDSAKPNSAIGFFFAREVSKELGVPVGLVQSDWGGTEVEVWIREGALRSLPDFASRIDENLKIQNTYQAEFAAWQKKIVDMETGAGAYQSPDFNDSSWTPLPALKSWEDMGMADQDGYAWYRARFELTLADLAGPATLSLGEIDDEDVTYVNGEKIGSMNVWNQKRNYTIPSTALRQGANVLAVRVLDTGGGGGFTTPGDLKLIIGGRTVPIAGWRMKQTINFKQTPPPTAPRWPAGDLYNGMIAPVIPYAFRGALWYQGESNVGRAFQYRTSFPFMIENWRKDWGQGDFPFYFAQIAPFAGYGGSGVSAELREAQLLTLKLKNTGMVVTTDVTDDVNNIHPVDKWDVGHRFALLAMNRAYGKKRVDSGPVYKSFKVEGDRIRVFFEPGTDDLTAEGAFSLPGLEIAGADRKFHGAQFKIDGKTLLVFNDEVPKPVAVRYGWADVPLPGLFNAAHLPASPFRTDDWPGLTLKNKW